MKSILILVCMVFNSIAYGQISALQRIENLEISERVLREEVIRLRNELQNSSSKKFSTDKITLLADTGEIDRVRFNSAKLFLERKGQFCSLSLSIEGLYSEGQNVNYITMDLPADFRASFKQTQLAVYILSRNIKRLVADISPLEGLILNLYMPTAVSPLTRQPFYGMYEDFDLRAHYVCGND